VAVVEGLSCQHPCLRLVDASSATGAGATHNVGARFARGDILAFCDADDVAHPGWVESWAHALADADLAGGLTHYWSLNDVPPPCPAVLRPPPTRRQFDYLDAAGSGNMAVRRDAFEQVGGFDEDLAVVEDIDLCWRMRLAGCRFTIGEGVISRREKSETYALLRRSIQFGRCAGLRRVPLSVVRAWLYLVATSPRLFDTGFRRTCVRNAGWRIGRLMESCRRLVFFP
jgi:glycosyltransferase involved in cell wall biosynthesis